MSQILLIGYGAIGRYVFEAVQASSHSDVAAVLCRQGQEARARACLNADIVCTSEISSLDVSFNLAVECAGHSAVVSHLPSLLRSGVDVLSVSSGALAEPSIAIALEQAAKDGNSTLHVVSGAVGALDALSAARAGGLDTVVYRGRKPPEGWKGSPAETQTNLDLITEAFTHFSGTAREAAASYPKNANVAASIALAGIGFDHTTVELIADPDISCNRHEIEAAGRFGQFTFRIDGEALPDNPRSSALTAMSLVRAIENRHSPITLI